MGTAYVKFGIETILHELGFPSDTKVRSFWYDADNPLVINIAVMHPELPNVKEGERLPKIKPLFIRGEDGATRLATWNNSEMR